MVSYPSPFLKIFLTVTGHIAYLLGKPENSRQVGTSLKHCAYIIKELNEVNDIEINLKNLPWWRVVLSSGKISRRENSKGQLDQARILKSEGVEVLESYSIDLDEFGWFPEEAEI
ncbi:uncharacterized protein PRCAT00001085001 [Priceomyces carsonii]|uniref:uncharacterized protein n=1 Tax=Priceomyces carsonii TaxID=28549 RepID=UPI002EDB5F2F|nr:unnamed protein product [Priceomyces carsonii]